MRNANSGMGRVARAGALLDTPFAALLRGLPTQELTRWGAYEHGTRD